MVYFEPLFTFLTCWLLSEMGGLTNNHPPRHCSEFHISAVTSTLTKTVKESKQEASYPTTMQTHNFTLLFTYEHNRTSKESSSYNVNICQIYFMLQRMQLIHSKMQNSRKASLRLGCMNPKEPRPSI